MNIDKIKIQKPFTKSNITILLILIYLIIFEFSWVTQSVFPKPSMLIESFLSLISDYNLANAFFLTTAIIFPAILIVMVMLEIFIKTFLTLAIKYSGIINIASPFKYFSFFFFALLFNSLFQQSLFGEFIFIVLFILGKLFVALSEANNVIVEEYVEAAKSLGLSKGNIFSKIIWKSIKPNIYSKLIGLHTEVWIVIIIYEFIGSVNGIGSIYRLAYDYKDIFAIISLGIFISIVILTVNAILKFIISKLVFWK
ncbi:MAG: ABC transporter permease subunit [Bacteroidetes bacterium]|nr:ABC transporter permease subunit [Bacteroidota bacterium]MBU1116124.1 ABC transporter permease subunit [Bacteroidota bacterium]MBU1800416.1 ABC transporter permease subunit [Bacteroidota bacterium]